MTVYIRDVDGVTHHRTGKRHWSIYWTWDRLSHRSDGRVHTWSDFEAALCQRAKDTYQTVELEIEPTAWGPRVQSVCLTPRIAHVVLPDDPIDDHDGAWGGGIAENH